MALHQLVASLKMKFALFSSASQKTANDTFTDTISFISKSDGSSFHAGNKQCCRFHWLFKATERGGSARAGARFRLVRGQTTTICVCAHDSQQLIKASAPPKNVNVLPRRCDRRRCTAPLAPTHNSVVEHLLRGRAAPLTLRFFTSSRRRSVPSRRNEL